MSWWQSDFQILFSPTWPSWNIYRYTLKYIGIKKKYWHFDNLNSQQITLTFFFCANASKTKQFENAQIARASTLESESELLIIQYSIQWVHYLLVILCILFIMRSCQTVSRQSESRNVSRFALTSLPSCQESWPKRDRERERQLALGFRLHNWSRPNCSIGRIQSISGQKKKKHLTQFLSVVVDWAWNNTNLKDHPTVKSWQIQLSN